MDQLIVEPFGIHLIVQFLFTQPAVYVFKVLFQFFNDIGSADLNGQISGYPRASFEFPQSFQATYGCARTFLGTVQAFFAGPPVVVVAFLFRFRRAKFQAFSFVELVGSFLIDGLSTGVSRDFFAAIAFINASPVSILEKYEMIINRTFPV